MNRQKNQDHQRHTRWEQLWKENFGALKGRARTIAPQLTNDELEDVLAQAMLELIRSEQDPTLPLMLTVVRRRTIDFLRRRRLEIHAKRLNSNSAAEQPRADVKLLRHELEAQVSNIVDSFDPEDAAMLWLWLFSDMTVSEISRSLGLPRATVFDRRRRLLYRLQNALNQRKFRNE